MCALTEVQIIVPKLMFIIHLNIIMNDLGLIEQRHGAVDVAIKNEFRSNLIDYYR